MPKITWEEFNEACPECNGWKCKLCPERCVTSTGLENLFDENKNFTADAKMLDQVFARHNRVFLHLGCDDVIIPTFLNFDPRLNGWKFEYGLGFLQDRSVDGITISHAFQCVEPGHVGFVLCEFFRVLKIGGVLRITDDNTEFKSSKRYKELVPGAKIYMGPHIMRKDLEGVGFTVVDQPRDRSLSSNPWMMIAERPDDYVFFIEGIKLRNSHHRFTP